MARDDAALRVGMMLTLTLTRATERQTSRLVASAVCPGRDWANRGRDREVRRRNVLSGPNGRRVRV